MRRARLTFGKQEINDMVLACLLISLAFAIASVGLSSQLLYYVIISIITVGIGFVLHELAHKICAHYYGCSSTFHANKQMLYIAILTSFFGFIFAAPGGVHLSGSVTKKQHAFIAAAGPLTNIVLGLVFLAFTPFGFLASYGLWINAYLAVFNMLPILGFDGKKIFTYNKPLYAGILFVSGALLFVSYRFV